MDLSPVLMRSDFQMTKSLSLVLVRLSCQQLTLSLVLMQTSLDAQLLDKKFTPSVFLVRKLTLIFLLKKNCYHL